MSRAREIADLVGGPTPDIILKTADGAILNLQTSDTTVTDGSVLGAINFTAPNEGSGTDAITIGGAIQAVAEGTFAADNNATELVFMTGASEAATSKMVLSSGGNLTVTGGLTVAGLPITGGSSSGRNMVINGGMNVAQRATSVTGLGATAGYFTVDRWKLDFAATAGRLTMSQTADGPNGISANCVKLDCTTADTSIAAGEYLMFETRFEGQNLQRIGKGKVGAQQITFSFYVKANAAFTFGIELFDNDNTRQITKLFDTTADWVRHEITFPADVDDGSSPFDDDNARS